MDEALISEFSRKSQQIAEINLFYRDLSCHHLRNSSFMGHTGIFRQGRIGRRQALGKRIEQENNQFNGQYME
jgi:hypothetical protein